MTTKTIGIILLSLGIVISLYIGFEFVQKKRLGSEERVEGQTLPFPWKPTAAAVCIAGGIILIAVSRRRTL
jgi:hypothetical protein